MTCLGFVGNLAGCLPASLNALSGGGGTLGLSAPVGSATRCRNVPSDVRAVQQALNSFSPVDGGPSPKLVVDGIYGPKTAAAISKFQAKSFGFGGSDGVVDPGEKTDRKLSGAGASPSSLPEEMYANIGRALSVISIARSQILAARTYKDGVASFTGMGDSSWKKLVRHFRIDSFPDWSTRLGAIDRLYSDMQTAIGHVPQGVVLFSDEPPGQTSGFFAFTFAGGYSLGMRGTKAPDGTPMDSIYFTPKMRTLTPDAFAYVMIHELAHFVGPGERTGNGITDWGYHRNPGVYQGLTPWQRIHNADCYSQYAFDSAGRPFEQGKHTL